MISFRPLMNSDRFLQRESIAYARATLAGSRVFQASSASRTFCIALSRVNGGNGGRAGGVGVAMISSPGIDSFGISLNSPHTFAFAPKGVPACQREVNDRQQHHHESIDKERAISQYENVTENYGSHPHNSNSRPQSGCLR